MLGTRRQLPQSSSADSPYNLLIVNSAFLPAGICSLWCSALFRAVVRVHSCEPLWWLSQAFTMCDVECGGLATCVCSERREWRPVCFYHSRPVYLIFTIQFSRFVCTNLRRHVRSVLDKISVQNSNFITLTNLALFSSKQLAWFWNYCDLTNIISAAVSDLRSLWVHIHSRNCSNCIW